MLKFCLSCLSFGLQYGVLPYPFQHASYQVSVRQYRPLQSRFLHSCRYQQRACDLLTVRSVTPACKGLSPSGKYIAIFQRTPCFLVKKILLQLCNLSFTFAAFVSCKWYMQGTRSKLALLPLTNLY